MRSQAHVTEFETGGNFHLVLSGLALIASLLGVDMFHGRMMDTLLELTRLRFIIYYSGYSRNTSRSYLDQHQDMQLQTTAILSPIPKRLIPGTNNDS